MSPVDRAPRRARSLLHLMRIGTQASRARTAVVHACERVFDRARLVACRCPWSRSNTTDRSTRASGALSRDAVAELLRRGLPPSPPADRPWSPGPCTPSAHWRCPGPPNGDNLISDMHCTVEGSSATCWVAVSGDCRFGRRTRFHEVHALRRLARSEFFYDVSTTEGSSTTCPSRGSCRQRRIRNGSAFLRRRTGHRVRP